MNIQAKIEELTAQQSALLEHRQQVLSAAQQDELNMHRLAGAIAVLNEQLSEECTHTLHSDDSGCTCHKCTCVIAEPVTQ